MKDLSRYLVPTFHFSEKDLYVGDLKKVMIDEYVKLYGEAVDEINPMYETWNDEFDAKHPDLDGFSKEYLDFIKEKHRPILEEKSKKSKLISLFTGDQGNIMARTFSGGTIYFTLRPLKKGLL